MNFGDLQTFLVNTVLQSAGDTDMLALAPTALNFAKLDIQRTHDYACMRTHLLPKAGEFGITLDTTVKRVEEVNLVADDGKVSRQLNPATQDEIRALRHIWRPYRNEIVQNDVTGYCRRLNINNRWWIQEMRILTSEDVSTGTSLRADVIRLLCDYVNDSDEDWFSTWGPDALAYKASELGFVTKIEENMLGELREMAKEKIAQLIMLDERFSAAGDADIVRPFFETNWSGRYGSN